MLKNAAALRPVSGNGSRVGSEARTGLRRACSPKATKGWSSLVTYSGQLQSSKIRSNLQTSLLTGGTHMERMLSYGTLIATITTMLVLADGAHAGSVVGGVRGPSPSGNLQGGTGGGCRGAACSVKGPNSNHQSEALYHGGSQTGTRRPRLYPMLVNSPMPVRWGSSPPASLSPHC